MNALLLLGLTAGAEPPRAWCADPPRAWTAEPPVGRTDSSPQAKPPQPPTGLNTLPPPPPSAATYQPAGFPAAPAGYRYELRNGQLWLLLTGEPTSPSQFFYPQSSPNCPGGNCPLRK